MAEDVVVGVRSSRLVERCQVCDEPRLEPVIFLGYLPPVNAMPSIGEPPQEQPSYPAMLLRCSRCQLVQLGLIVDPGILFPPGYPYTSGTTKILRDNFAELAGECRGLMTLDSDDLVVDIGSNDGTLLSNFVERHRVLGVEPTNAGELAAARGIPTLRAFFDRERAGAIRLEHGPAALVTATNVFAHMDDIHGVTDGIVSLLDEDGIFVSESHYLLSLLATVQYDTIYHEHLRYYSLSSLTHLLQTHGLSVIHAKRIPTHGGSLRVYAARTGRYPVRNSVASLLEEEEALHRDGRGFEEFKARAVLSKLELHALLADMKRRGCRIYGVGAPSRASTLINYVGLDDGIVDCVVEVKGSHKIGKYVPGTRIPVVDESRLYAEQPEYALLLSWHIAEELAPKLWGNGYRGAFIVPLPSPRLLRREGA